MRFLDRTSISLRLWLAAFFLLAAPLSAAADTDGDGMPNAWESLYSCLDPLVGDSALDPDTDTLSSLEEFQNQSNPCLADTDADQLPDPDELALGTNVGFWDTDTDNLPDGYEDQNALHGLDPLVSQPLSQDTDLDTNPDVHEYWNGTDPWAADPVGGAGCYYWGEADGDGLLGPGDITVLQSTLKGYTSAYPAVIPSNTETQEIDMDGVRGPGDLTALRNMTKTYVANLPSRVLSLARVAPAEPSVAVGVGDTVRLTVSTVNAAGLRTPGFGVVFTLSPSSTASAVLIGGDGSEGTGRYDVSGPIADGVSQVVVRMLSTGSATIDASLPVCGVDGVTGKYSPALLLPAVLTITAADTSCRDVDLDGYYSGCLDYLTHPGPDCDDYDANNWQSCALCLDLDGDDSYAGCDTYATIAGPDCSDSDPNNWSSCAACVDGDTDLRYVGCDRYLTIPGPDCSDADPDNWLSCATCVDGDTDGRFTGCDAYATRPGPDCNDLDSDIWTTCATCVDQDQDGYYQLCNLYTHHLGPDCSDADPNNWTNCATCRDRDLDSWFVLCNRYSTISGPDCNDNNTNAYIKCATCTDGDGDGFYAGCDRYFSVPGPDRNDALNTFTNYFIITVTNTPPYSASVWRHGNTDEARVTYPGAAVYWVNPKLLIQNLSVTADGASVSFDIRNNSATNVARIWMLAWPRDAQLSSLPRLKNSAGDNLYIIGPIAAGASVRYTLAASGFGASYRWYLDFLRVEERVAYTTDRRNHVAPNYSDVFTADIAYGNTYRVTTNNPVYSAGSAWSPGGEYIAFLRGAYATCQTGATIETLLRPQVYIIHPDSSNLTRISTNSPSSGYMTWNPRGTVIAYDCGPDCYHDFSICTYNLKTGERNVRFTGEGYLWNSITMPRWSPDGTMMLMFVQDQESRRHWLYAHVDPETGAALETPRAFTDETYPMKDANNYWRYISYTDFAWGPDSRHLAFYGSLYDCYLYNVAGGTYSLAVGVNCDDPPGPNYSWRGYFGTGTLDFNEVLNSDTLPMLPVLRADPRLSYRVSPCFRQTPLQLWTHYMVNSATYYIQYYTVDSVTYAPSSRYTWLTADGFENTVPALYPPALPAYFPITP